MATDKSIQKALTEPYSLPYFSQHVLQPVFGEHLTIHASSILMPLNPSETRAARSIKKYGEIKLTDYRQVDLYEVALSEGVVVERNKVGIGTIVKKLIAGNNAVLANFYYPDHPERSWRFSFIAKDQILEEGEVERVETNPKRYTYILGPNERCKTAGERFSKLSTQPEFTVKAFEDAFSVEKLSRKFFEEYKEHYQAFVDHLSKRVTMASVFNGDEKVVRDFAKKLLGRIVFLHFVQKKGWLGATSERWQDGNRNFIQDLFVASGKKETFYPLWLRTLFYDSLNNPERESNGFKLPSGTSIMVPYLNGGLFEDDDPKGVLTFPPRLFEDLFEFFNQYNFTIYEDSPDDHIVAVDPEMLGHIFENLLEDNKDKGAYYTPKEIVHYMCQESLIEYLATKLGLSESVAYQELGKDQTQMFGNEAKKGQFDLLKQHKKPSPGITRQDVERFVKYKETTEQIVAHGKEINKHLDEVKVCDPAIGSGAFPMGLLQEIFHAKLVLKETEVSELHTVSDAEMKERIIQNSIYGVDIEKGAVDIARLRFWLSLIVDEELPRPLPNLDFKIVVGDSLLPKIRLGDIEEIIGIDWNVVTGETDRSVAVNKILIDKQRFDLLQLVTEQRKYFSAKRDKDKIALKQRIRDLKIEILINQLKLDKLKYASKHTVNEELFGFAKKEKQKEFELTFKLAGFQKAIKHLEQLQKHPNKPLQFFDWKLDFPEILNSAIEPRAGFDIVIGNPPYFQLQKLPAEQKKALASQHYHSFSGASDLYCLFYERAIDILCTSGVLCFISSNKFAMSNYGSELRKFLSTFTIAQIMDFGELRLFEKAATFPMILILRKVVSDGDAFFVQIRDLELGSLHQQSRNNSISVDQSFFKRTQWSLLASDNSELVDRIKAVGLPLNQYTNEDILFGVKTGLNAAFIIDQSTRDKLVGLDPRAHEILKPLLNGDDIRKFRVEYKNHYLIATKIGIDIKSYPGVFQYLQKHRKALEKRSDKGNHWWELRPCTYYHRFEQPKIIYPDIALESRFAIDYDAYYPNATCFVIPKEDKYLLGILNSRLMWYYLSKSCPVLGDVGKRGRLRLKTVYLKDLPVAIAKKDESATVVRLVDRIIAAKNSGGVADTTSLEREIDLLVYHLYDLTYAEAKVIDPALTKEEFEKGW